MKKPFLFLALFASFFVEAQSLKEALFSGKLKNEPGTVIRKGDDLSTKMDTAVRKAPARDTLAVFAAPNQADSANGQKVAVQKTITSDTTAGATAANPVTPVADSAAQPETAQPTDAGGTPPAPEPVVAKPKSNRTLFKDYMVDLAASLKGDVLSTKKVKKGSYFVTVAYTIETDGAVTITNIDVDPKNEFLQQQIKERIEQGPPQLNPELNSQGVARKINRTYSFTLDKE
jgi:hypothetical protein